MNKKDIERFANKCLLPDTCSKSEIIETHISWVLLSDHYAFKFKRPVKYSFLDYSDVKKREFFCYKELELNRRLAPEIYLDVLPVTNEGVLEKTDKAPVDYCVKMKKMDKSREMDILLMNNDIDNAAITKIANTLVNFHKNTKSIKNAFNSGEFAKKFNDILTIADPVEDLLGISWKNKIINAVNSSDKYINGHKMFLNERVISGFIRDCHGDLTAKNIIVNNEPVIFDCIEFDDNYRYIDVLNELAFLMVDLDSYGNFEQSQQLYDEYMNKSGMKKDDQTNQLLSYYQCYRANVRAKIDYLNGVKNDNLDLTSIKSFLDLMEQYKNNI